MQDSIYQPHLRLTETSSGFGNRDIVNESYRGSDRDPSEIIQSINRDIANLRASINELDNCSNRRNKLHEINTLKDTLNENIQMARDAIHSKVAQGTDKIVIDRLKKQLDEAVKDAKKLQEDLLKKLKAENVEESTVIDDSYPSNTGSGRQHESTDQGFAQVQVSAVEQRESEAEAIRHLERDILDLNVIHKDLNKNIHDQGKNIADIVQPTESAGIRVAEGKKNTDKIRELAISKRNLICIILSIVGGVAIVIVVVIIIIAIVLSRNN